MKSIKTMMSNVQLCPYAIVHSNTADLRVCVHSSRDYEGIGLPEQRRSNIFKGSLLGNKSLVIFFNY